MSNEDKEVKTNDIYIISEKSVPRKDTPSLYGQPLEVANKQECSTPHLHYSIAATKNEAPAGEQGQIVEQV
jgi:hypothetical protein